MTDDADDPTIDSEDLSVDADSKTYDAEFPIVVKHGVVWGLENG